jgi:hypothetical protein
MAAVRRDPTRHAPSSRHVFVLVPWERALVIRERLLELGVKSVARFDPQDRQAKLEILQDIDPGRIHNLLKSTQK